MRHRIANHPFPPLPKTVCLPRRHLSSASLYLLMTHSPAGQLANFGSCQQNWRWELSSYPGFQKLQERPTNV